MNLWILQIKFLAMDRKEDKYFIKLGVFVVFGIVIFFIIIYILGKNRNLFTSNIKIYGVFENVYGLTEGNKVRLLGIDVGTVAKIKIISENKVLVEMSIQNDIVKFVPKNSIATIGTEGITGNKIVVIIPGTIDYRAIKSRDTLNTLKPIEIDDILKEIKKTSENITKVSENLIGVTDKINRGEGIFGKIFTDTVLSANLDKVTRNIVDITEKLNEISGNIKKGEGLLGTILVDTNFSKNLEKAGKNFELISRNLNKAIEKINKGEGLLGKLYYDSSLTQRFYKITENITDVSIKLNVASENLKIITSYMVDGEGVVNKILVDSAFADSIGVAINKLNRALDELINTSEVIRDNKLIKLFSKKKKKAIDTGGKKYE